MKLEGCSVVGLPFFGEHSDLDVRAKLAWLVRVGRHSLMFAADSCNIEPRVYEHIHKEVGDIDALFVGMECDGAPLTWLYSPYLSTPIGRKEDDSRRLSGSDAEHAWRIVEEMGCKTAHVYALGQEPWLKYVAGLEYTEQSKQIVESAKFVQRCRDNGMQSERLYGCQTMEF
jgi:hypothetical protein